MQSARHLFLELPLINATAPLKVHTQREIKTYTHTKMIHFATDCLQEHAKVWNKFCKKKIIKTLVESGKEDLTQRDLASYGSHYANLTAFLQ